MPPIEPEGIAARALRDYLLRTLPAKVAALNALRAAVLRAPLAGPYVIPSGTILRLTASGAQAGAAFNTTVTTGTRTATQVAADINTAAGATIATSDAQARLTLTAPTAPVAGAPSVLFLAGEAEALTGPAAAGTNAIFGFDAGGNHVVRSAVVAPTYRCVCDGFPVVPEFDGGGTLNLVIGDRTTAPDARGIRTDMHDVELDLVLLRADPDAAVQASRDGIQASLRAVREVLLTDAGRRLDNPLDSDGNANVMLVTEVTARVSAVPFQFADIPTLMFDNANLRLRARMYSRAP